MARAFTSGDRARSWLRWITRLSLVLGLVALAITVWAVGLDTIADHLRTIGPWFVVLLAIEATVLVLLSQLLHRGLVWATIVASGYMIGAPQLIGVLSAGLVLNWISTIVPMGVGVSEGGNCALFTIIGAPPALGVALALARRVNQLVFAALGFGVLMADGIATKVDQLPVTLSPIASSTTRHVVVVG